MQCAPYTSQVTIPHTSAAAPINHTRHRQPFSMLPIKSPIATVRVHSIRGVGLVVPHKTI